MFFIAYAFKGQEHVFAGQVKIVSHLSCSKNCKSLVLQDKCNIEILLSPAVYRTYTDNCICIKNTWEMDLLSILDPNCLTLIVFLKEFL